MCYLSISVHFYGHVRKRSVRKMGASQQLPPQGSQSCRAGPGTNRFPMADKPADSTFHFLFGQVLSEPAYAPFAVMQISWRRVASKLCPIPPRHIDTIYGEGPTPIRYTPSHMRNASWISRTSTLAISDSVG